MARGNQGRDIYVADRNRELWLKTLGDACEKTGCRRLGGGALARCPARAAQIVCCSSSGRLLTSSMMCSAVVLTARTYSNPPSNKGFLPPQQNVGLGKSWVFHRELYRMSDEMQAI